MQDVARFSARCGSFRRTLCADAAADIGQALRLDMPVDNDRFASVIRAWMGFRQTSAKPRRSRRLAPAAQVRMTEQVCMGS